MRSDQKWRAMIGLLLVGILISFGLSCGGGGGSNGSKESIPEVFHVLILDYFGGNINIGFFCLT